MHSSPGHGLMLSEGDREGRREGGRDREKREGGRGGEAGSSCMAS